MLSKIREIRKAIAAALGVGLTVLVFVTENLGGILPSALTVPVGILVAVLTPVVTWLTPNGDGDDADAKG